MPYIGNTIRAADDYRLIDDISSGFNGSETSFALQVAGSAPVPFPKSPQQVLISVNGVIQEPDPTGSSGFNLVGTNIVFSSAPTNGHAFFGIIYATADYLNAGGNFPAGSLGAPSITFIGDENTGLFRKSGGSVGFVSDATEIANFDSNGITISSGNIIIPDSIIHNGDSNTKIRFPAADTITAETGGTERQRINSDGQLLINQTASSGVGRQLQIGSNTGFGGVSLNRFSADTGSSGLDFIKSRNATIGSNTIVQNDDNLGAITWRGADGTDFATPAAQIKVAVDGTPGSNDMPGRIMLFTTADGASSLTERLRIDNAGNVGIGITNPTTTLHLDASGGAVVQLQRTSSNASNRLAISHDGNDGTLDSSNALLFRNNGAERMRIDSSGRLLINKTTNRDKYFNGTYTGRLQVEGTDDTTRLTQLVHNSNSASQHIFVLGKSRGGVGSYTSVADGDFLGTISFQGADGDEMVDGARIEAQVNGTPGNDAMPTDLLFKTNTGGASPTERMRIAENGNIGIGTTSPDRIIHCHNSSNTTNVRAKFSNGTTGEGASDGFEIGINGSDPAQAVLVNYENSPMAFFTNASERMRIDSSGNVGINDTSPTAELSVAATAPHIDIGAAGGTRMKIGYEGNNCFFGGTASTAMFIFKQNVDAEGHPQASGTERMRIDSSGRLLVGTTTEGETSADNFTIADTSSDCGISIRSGTSNAGNIFFSDGTSGNDEFRGYVQYNHASNYMRFATDSTERVRITSYGGVNVGSGALNSNVADGNIFVDEGIYIGSFNGDNQIRHTSAGAGSSTLYIGNQAIQTSSDRRIKENIVDTKIDASSQLKKVRVVDFTWNDTSDKAINNRNSRGKWTGCIAQEIVDVFPFAVNAPRPEGGEIDHDSEALWGMEYNQLVPVLIKGFQELQAKIETLETKVAALEAA